MAKDRVEAGRGRGKGVVNPGKSGRKPGPNRGFYLLLGALAVAGIALLGYMAARSGPQVTTLDSAAAVPNQGHVMGSDSARVEVVEFADFECPACGSFANLTEPDVRARLVNTGQVRFRFMDFPLDIHRNTMAAHNAAWCGSEQGKFWEMHDGIFQNQDRWATQATRRPESVLENVARSIALNMDQYRACMSSNKYHPQIRANYNEAVRLGIQSTPTFVVGNRRIPGAISYDQFKRYVDEAAAAAPAPAPPR